MNPVQVGCWLSVIEKKKRREEIAFIVPSGLNEKGDGLGVRGKGAKNLRGTKIS